ncbi:hypothetical protein [Alienimonas californiensis]|uniref:Uncharacterized protein n=1 Tax=Alienimonas californiensis TaxID=2527989 RepID=A0A517P524_9PLAN|nr:hypothetical protein [Alienimonas californiensis]QDT14474.1 hypothetical protein CA12_05480 [Alienimonas californiensis]
MKTLLKRAAAGLLAIVPAVPQTLPGQTLPAPGQPYYDDFGGEPLGGGSLGGPTHPFSFDPADDRRFEDDLRYDAPRYQDDLRTEDRVRPRSGRGEGAARRPGADRQEGFEPATETGGRGCWGVNGQCDVPTLDRDRTDDLEPRYEANRDGRRPVRPASSRRTRPADDFGDDFGDRLPARPADGTRRPRRTDERGPRSSGTFERDPQSGRAFERDFMTDFDPSYDGAASRCRDEAALPPWRTR